MNKMKKRFIALLVVFTSIISFLPVGFSGQAAKCSYYKRRCNCHTSICDGSTTALTATTDTTNQEEIYTTTLMHKTDLI